MRPPSEPAADVYAAKYMKGEGRVLLRDKFVGRGLVWILGLVTLWVGAGTIAAFVGGLPGASVRVGILLAAMTTFFAVLTMTLTVVRTVVSEGQVYVQYGLWGPRVPIARVRGSRVVAYDWTKFGGWGIKRSMDGTWAYVLKGMGDVVELRWVDEGGADKTVLFSASDPRAVVDAIERARACAGGSRLADEASRPNAVRISDEATSEEGAGEDELDPHEQKRRRL